MGKRRKRQREYVSRRRAIEGMGSRASVISNRPETKRHGTSTSIPTQEEGYTFGAAAVYTQLEEHVQQEGKLYPRPLLNHHS